MGVEKGLVYQGTLFDIGGSPKSLDFLIHSELGRADIQAIVALVLGYSIESEPGPNYVPCASHMGSVKP